MGRDSETHLGEFEQLVLLALLHFDRGGNGMQVRETIEARAGRNSSIGAVYATLDRLEEKGLVTSKQLAPDPDRGGRPRRIFKTSAEGRKAVLRALDTVERMVADLRPLKP